jgi:hypothetical protein
MLRVLVEHRVDFIVVGGLAAVLQGAPLATLDLDVVHSRAAENLPRLLAAVGELDAIYREQPSRRLRPQLSHLASPGHQLLTTTSGPLDLLGTVGTNLSFEDLLPHTAEWDIEPGLRVRLLDLPTIIRLKEEAGRPKDLAALPVLRQTLAEKSP